MVLFDGRIVSTVFVLFSLGLAASPVCALPHRRTTPLRVRTSRGIVEGYEGTISNRFVLPYAQAPTGVRRFADPVALGSFNVYDGTKLPNACAQDALNSIQSFSEDCLYITIYTPPGSISATANLPVFVWVHGGSFLVGSTTMSGLDGSALARSQNVIVVTVQYRLGTLGFLKLDSLGVSGNFGLKDLMMALTYIGTEIRAFGGNPKSVTLAGQSSGAEMIQSLLVIPSATKLFTRTILHSASTNFGEQSVSVGNAIGASLAANLSCTTLACLRSTTVSDIIDAQYYLSKPGSTIFAGKVDGASVAEPLRTVLDGSLVTRSFGEVVGGGGTLAGNGKPIIITTVQDEACNAIAGNFQGVVPNTYFDGTVQQLYPTRAAAILSSNLYDPAANASDGFRTSFTALTTDESWVCKNQQYAVNLTVANPAAPVYLAQFNIGISYTNNSIPFCADKVAHQDDIYAVFGQTPVALSRSQLRMSREVLTRWGAFARTGSPNAAGSPYSAPTWLPVSSATSLNLLVLGGGRSGASVVAQSQRPAECQLGVGIWGRTVPFTE